MISSANILEMMEIIEILHTLLIAIKNVALIIDSCDIPFSISFSLKEYH